MPPSGRGSLTRAARYRAFLGATSSYLYQTWTGIVVKSPYCKIRARAGGSGSDCGCNYRRREVPETAFSHEQKPLLFGLFGSVSLRQLRARITAKAAYGVQSAVTGPLPGRVGVVWGEGE